MKKLNEKNIFLIVGSALGVAYACRYISLSKDTDLIDDTATPKKIEFKQNLSLYDYPLNVNNNEDHQVTLAQLLDQNDLKRLVYHKTLYSLGLASDARDSQLVAMNGTLVQNANKLTMRGNQSLIANCLGTDQISNVIKIGTKNFLASMLDVIIAKVKTYPNNENLSEIDIQRICASVLWAVMQKYATSGGTLNIISIGTSFLVQSEISSSSRTLITKYPFLVDRFFDGYFNCEVPLMNDFYVLGGDKNNILLTHRAIPNDAEGAGELRLAKKAEPMFFKGIIYYNDEIA